MYPIKRRKSLSLLQRNWSMAMKHCTFCSVLIKSLAHQLKNEWNISHIMTLWSKVGCMSIMPVKDKILYVSKSPILSFNIVSQNVTMLYHTYMSFKLSQHDAQVSQLKRDHFYELALTTSSEFVDRNLDTD